MLRVVSRLPPACLFLLAYVSSGLAQGDNAEPKFEDHSVGHWQTSAPEVPKWTNAKSRPNQFYSKQRQKSSSEQTLSKVYFVTNRKPPESGLAEGTLNNINFCNFSDDRINPRGAVFGEAQVYAPIDRDLVSDARQYSCKVAATLGTGTDITRLRELLGQTAGSEIVMHVHGFATSFDNSVARAAFLAAQLSPTSVGVAFSWPSQKPRSVYYAAAEENMAMSSLPLEAALAQILTLTKVKIHIVGHSLGARLLASSFKEMFSGRHVDLQKLSTVKSLTFAAADISVDEFQTQFMPILSKLGSKFAIYSSAQDAVLSGWSSCLQKRDERLGTLESPRRDWRKVDFTHVKQASVAATVDYCGFRLATAYWFPNLHSYFIQEKVITDWKFFATSQPSRRTSNKNKYGVREIPLE